MIHRFQIPVQFFNLIFLKNFLYIFFKSLPIYIKMKFSNCWSKGCLCKTKVSSGVTDKHIHRKTCVSLKCRNSTGERDGHFFYCLLCNRHYTKRDKVFVICRPKNTRITGSPKMFNDDMTTNSHKI